MSTKTSIKRIAAVAAVALTLGGFSAVSAHAAATATIAVTGATGTGTNTVTATAATSTYVSATITFTGDVNNATQITSSGIGTINVPSIAAGVDKVATTGITTTSAVAFASHASTDVPGTSTRTLSNIDGASTVGTLAFSAYSATAGIQTISVASSTGTSTLTITWGAAAGTVYNHSSVYISTTTNADATADSTSLTASSAASDTAVALFTVRQYSTSDTTTALTDAAATAVSVAVSGAGSVAVVGGYRGPSAAVAAGATSTHGGGESTTGTQSFKLYANGVAGVSTITVTVNGVVASTKTFTFVGTPAAVKAVGNLKVLKAGGVAGTATGNVYNGTSSATDATTVSGTTGLTPLTVFLTDVNGNPAALGSYVAKATSSDTTVINSVSACDVVNAGADAVVGELNCAITGVSGAASGKTATVTVNLYKSDGTTLVASAAPVTFAIGGAIAKTVLSTDATDYTALAPIKVLVTSTDASGNAAYDQDVTAVGTIVSSIQLGGTLASPAKIIGGVGSKTGAYAPAATYTGVTISGTDSTSAANAISTSFNVASPSDSAAQAAIDAAQEATDAANAAYDAANNAMDSADAATAAAQDASDNASAALAAVTALSATVAKLVASVNSIAAALAKIQKKLKA